MKIKGAVLETAGARRPYARSHPLIVRELNLDPPGPGEVLVRIEIAGLCHSDLSVIEGARPRPLPMVLGHEAAGIIEEVGPAVDEELLGKRVALTFLARCGRCDECLTDGRLPCRVGSAANQNGALFSGARRVSDSLGPLNHHLGVSGFATHAVVDVRSVVPVDDDVPPVVAALCGCAVLTGGGAVLNAARPRQHDNVVVVGLGGVGMAALMTARAMVADDSRIIGVDSNPDKLRAAQQFGASETYTPADALQAGVRSAIIVEAAGSASAFETAIDLASAGGTVVTVGLPKPSERSQVSPLRITSDSLTIVGSYQGSAVAERDVPMFLDLWRAGRLPIEQLATQYHTLSMINDALDELSSGSGIRHMITPD